MGILRDITKIATKFLKSSMKKLFKKSKCNREGNQFCKNKVGKKGGELNFCQISRETKALHTVPRDYHKKKL